MSTTSSKLHHPPASTTNVLSALSGVLHELNRTAEAMLSGLRQQLPAPLDAITNSDSVLSGLDGDEQLRELRAAMPRRPLTVDEGLLVAEHQAALLRWQLASTSTPTLPTRALAGLPFLTVTRRPGLAKSAMAIKTEQGWVIVLRADEPQARQRFSLAHEIKHVLDDELLERVPDGLYHSGNGGARGRRAERVCDFFAGCLLIPKQLLRRDWTARSQDPAVLARRYDVSRSAMEVRLHQIGLLEAPGRCATRSTTRLDFAGRQSDDPTKIQGEATGPSMSAPERQDR